MSERRKGSKIRAIAGVGWKNSPQKLRRTPTQGIGDFE
jgi:hypothetical protein